MPLNRRQCLLALTSAWPCAPGRAQALAPGVSRTQIQIGQVLSLDGGRNELGVAVRQGVEAALQVIHAAGGVHGRLLAVRVKDDQGQPELARQHARSLVDEGAFLLFGSVEGGPSMAIVDVAQAQSVPFFAPMAGSPGLRVPHQPMVFPVRAPHRAEFDVLLRQARSLGIRRTALVHADTDVGRQHLAHARALAQDLGLDAVQAVPAPLLTSDATLSLAVQRLALQSIEMVFNHGAIDLFERLIRRARGAGLGLSFWGVNSGASQLVHRLGPLAQGMRFTQVVPSPWERKTALTREYQAAFHAVFPDESFSYASLEAYFSTRVLAEALRRAGPRLTRAHFLEALGSVALNVAGMTVRYQDGAHTGCPFVDTALVTRDGRFRH